MKPTRKSQRPTNAKLLRSRSLGKTTSFLSHVPFPYLLVDRSGIILEANAAAAQMLRQKPDALKDLPLRNFVCEPDQHKIEAHLHQCDNNAQNFSTTLRLELPGTPSVCLVTKVGHSARSEKLLLHTMIYHKPVNEHESPNSGVKEKELERLYRTLHALGKSSQAMQHAANGSAYMNEVCKIVQEDCGHAMVWIGFAQDDETKSIDPVAFAGFEEGYLQTLKLTWADTERGRGPTGTAIRMGQPSMCRNMQSDPRFAPWRDEAIRRGYASSIALPLTSSEATFGAVTIYSREPDPFSDEEVKLLMELAGDLSQGLTSLRLHAAREAAEFSLRESEERHRSLFEHMTEGFALHEIITDSHGQPCDYRFLEVNPSYEQLTGLKGNDLVGKRVREVLPHHQPLSIEKYGKVALTGEPVRFESYSAPLGRWFEVFSYRPAPMQFAAIFTDITERKQAEDARRQVEGRVRRKLESILMPDGDLSALELGDLIDVPGMKKLMDDFYALAHFSVSILDLKGNVLVGAGWQDICTKYHRVHPETCKRCVESDTELSANVPPGEFRLYKCKNSLWDVATPIIINGKQVGNVFSGQFFFDDEKVDLEGFREQAREFGFDEEPYLDALNRVPRFSHATVRQGMAFLLKLADMLSRLGYSNMNLARLLVERERLARHLHEEQDRLKQSKEKYATLFNTTSDGVGIHDLTGTLIEVNDAYCTMSGYAREELIGMPVSCLEATETPAEIVTHIQKVIDGGGHDRFESRHRRKDGSFIHVDVTALYFGLDGGRMAIFVRDITDRKRVAERAERKTAVVTGIAQIFQEAMVCKSEEQLGGVCLRIAEEITKSKFGFIGEINPVTGKLDDIAVTHPGWDASRMQDTGHGRELPMEIEIHGLYGRVLKDGKGFFTNEPATPPHAIGVPEGDVALTAFLGVPLSHAGRTVGILALANRAGGYSADDLHDAEALAAVIIQAFLRKRAEEALEVTKQRLEAHIDNSPLAVIEFDPEFRVTRWSSEAERLFGWSSAELTGRSISQIPWVYEEDIELVSKVSAQMLTGERPRNLNVNRNYRKDGSIVLCEWYNSALYDNQGRLASILSLVLDITERSRAEQALQESEERFRLAIQHSRLMVWQCDAAMRFTWAYNSHFGIPDEQLLGKTPAELGNPEGMAEFVAHGASVLTLGAGTRKTIRLKAVGGQDQYFDQQVEAMRDTEGHVVGVIGISLEVTERVLAEQRLHRSVESFRLMVAHSEEPTLLIDESGAIDCVSRRAADRLGYAEAELIGVRVDRFLDWNGKLDLSMRLEDFLRHAPAPATGVLRVRHKDGSWCWLDIHASFVNYGQHPEKYLLKFEKINTEKAK